MTETSALDHADLTNLANFVGELNDIAGRYGFYLVEGTNVARDGAVVAHLGWDNGADEYLLYPGEAST